SLVRRCRKVANLATCIRNLRGRSSVGEKRPAAREGRCRKCGVVVRLVRTPACQAGGRRFEPGRPRHISKDLRLLTSRIELDCDANCDITPSKVPPNSPWLNPGFQRLLREHLDILSDPRPLLVLLQDAPQQPDLHVDRPPGQA